MAETYDIAPYDPTVKQDDDLFDSAKETDPQNEFPIGEPTAGFTPSPTPVGLSAQHAAPAPIPPPDPFPFIDEPSAPSEAELRDAWVKLQPNGGLAPEVAAKYGDTLRRGAETEKNEKLAQQKESFKAQYRSPDGVLQMAKDPTVRREMDASPDDDLVIKRALNRSFIASTYGKPNASPEELDAIMREHSIKNWGINNPSQETFYTKTREDVAKSDEDTKVWRSMSTTVAQKILEDQLAGKQTSFSETFEKFATANPKSITAQNKDEWYMTGLLMDERLRKLDEHVRFPASQLIDVAGKMTAGTATELDWDRATNALRGVNPTDLEQILKVASIAVREQDPNGEMIKTVIGNIGKRFDRDFNLSKVYEQDRELLLNDQIKNLEAGMTIGKSADGRLVFAQPGQPLPSFATPLDQAEYNQYWNDAHRAMDGMAIARVIQQFQEQVADPVVPYFKGGLLGAAEAGAYDIAGFSKLIPLGLIPGPAGLLSMAKVVSASTYHDIRTENPNLPIEAARDWANIDGVFNSVGMKFKADFLLGHYPFFKSVRQLKGAGQTIEALKVYGRWAAIHNLEENFEELAQDTASAALAKLYGDAYPDSVKQQTWGDMLVDIARTRPQVAMAVGPLSLIGAGHATVRDLRNPMRDFMNPDSLKSVGLKDEAVAEILASKDLSEAEKIFRKHYNTLTKEDLKRGFEYAAGLTEKDEVDEAMADPAMPTIDPVVMPDGTYKYNVLSPDGTVLSTHTDPDVAETAWVRETERVKGENWAAEQNAAAQQAAAEAAAAASDEGVAKEAEAKAEAETVSPEDRLGTAMTVEFEENAAPTPEESREVAQLQSDVQAAGRSDVIVLARPSDAQAGPGQASLNFIRAFERATGKRVVFVASGNDQPLSFTGVVRNGDPNTIFLDAHGDRNVLALVGHEWSHTLEHTSPELHAEMIGRMKPLIIEWAKQEGILAKEVGPEGVTNEMVANIVGDAISNENFWTVLAQKNPSLFEKVRDAVLKFLDQFIGKVQKSEFGTEAFVKDAVQMREIVADIMHRAGQGAEAPAGAEAGVSFAPRRGEHKMDIERQARFTSKETEYTPEEKKDLESKLSKLLNKAGIKGKARAVVEAQHRQELEDEIRRQRERHPIVPPPGGAAYDKWIKITPVDVEIVTKKEKGKPDREVAIPVWQKEAYQFDKSDMSKVVAGMVADVKDIVRRAKAGDPNAVTQLRQRGWYRNMTVRLRTEFGGFSDLFADLLGATSPNTQVDQNWKLSIIALREVTRGTYDKELAHFDAWLKSGRTVKEYKDSGQPQILQPNGKLFGMNSDKAMKAMLDFWRVVKAGDSPKARNFALNLIGQSFKATIDVWAARYLGRMALNDRIPVIAEKAISGKHKVDVTKVGAAFGYGQEAFRQATEILVREMPEEFAGMQPPDLQAVVWFREKEIWGRNNWTSTSGEGGSFEASADVEQVQRYVAGLSHERPKAIPTTEQQETASRNLNTLLAGFPETIATRVKNSIGMYDGKIERSFDIELLASPGFDPWQMVMTVAESASANNQDSTFISRVIQAGEPINPNARPGIEVYLKEDVDLEAMNAIMDAIKEGGTDGFTMVVDPRKEVGPQGVRGIRAQYIPEFGGPEEWQNEAAQKEKAIRGILSKVIAMDGVANAQLVSYDTLVLTRDDYGNNLTQSELSGKDVGGSRAGVWRERASDAARSRATQGGEGGGAVSEAAIPDRVSEPQPPRGRPPPSGQVAFAGRRAAAVEAETAARMAEPEGRVAFFQKIRDRVQSLIKEHDTRREGRLPPEKIDPANDLARLDNAVRAKMEGIDRREQAALDKISLRVLSQFNAPADTGVKLQDLENQRQSEIEAAERDWQKTFSRESKNISDLTFQQRLVTFERIRGLERQYKERLRGIRNVYRERGRALLQAVATDKAAAETAIKDDTRLASEVEKRFDVERREAERQHEMRQKQIEQRAELRTKIGQQAFESKETRRRLIESLGEFNAMLKALPEELRGKIGGVVEIARITDEEQMAKFFAQRIARMDEVLEHHLRLDYQERINNLLATYKPKKTPGGVLKSRIGADAQETVDRIARYSKMTGEQLTARLREIENTIAAGGLDEEAEAILVIEQHELTYFGDTAGMTAEELSTAHKALKQTIAAGKSSWGKLEEDRLADQKQKAEAIVGVVGIGTPPGIAKKKRQTLHNGLMNFARSHVSFVQLLDRLFPGLDFIPKWQSTAISQEGASMDHIRETNERLLKAIAAAIGTPSKVRAGSALKAMTEPVVQGPRGMMNKREAIQYLFAWGQPQVRERMILHGWTQEHVDAITAATNDAASQALIRFFQAEYENIYQRANVVYQRMYGMALPRIEGQYAPMRYEGAGGPADITPTGAYVSSGVTPSALKARVGHSAELSQVDALDVFEEHLNQMSHWIHMAEFIRETRGVFNNAEVKKSLKQSIGDQGLNDLNKQLDAITRNGVTRSSDVSGINQVINHLTTGIATSSLAFNLHSAAVQGDAFLRWMSAIPIQRWWRPLAMHQWIGKIPEAWSSEAVQRRLHNGISPAMQHAMATNGWTHPWLLKAIHIGFLPITAFDVAGTTFTSAIVYADAKAQNMSDEQAIQKMDEAVARFAQPIMVTTKSGALLNASPAMKSILLFMADPMLKTSLAMEGVLELRRGNIERGARLILAVEAWALVSQLILNTWSHFFPRDGDDDDEDGWLFENFWRAAALAPIQGFFVAGNIAEAILSGLTGEKYWFKQPSSLKFTEKTVRTALNWEKLMSMDPSDADFIKEINDIIEVAGISAGRGPAAAAGFLQQAEKWKNQLEK